VPGSDDPARRRTFVSEPLIPEPGTGSVDAMARGEPGLPRAFIWRGRRFEVARVLESGKAHGEDRGDVYVRKHWYDVETTTGEKMRIYFDRNPGPGRAKSLERRWWVYWVEEAG
jgi:uncharacterized protein DUF6504